MVVIRISVGGQRNRVAQFKGSMTLSFVWEEKLKLMLRDVSYYMDVTYFQLAGTISTLSVHLEDPCEQKPYLGMNETCKSDLSNLNYNEIIN